MINSFDNNLRVSFEEAHINFIQPILRKAFTDDSIFEIVSQNILSPFSFYLANELKNSDLDRNIIIECLNKVKLKNSNSIIVDSSLLINSKETRGEKFELVESSSEEKAIFRNSISELVAKLPPTWAELISIIKSVTFVKINGKENLLSHFSGSDTYRWGAMHMFKNLNLPNMAECITHEASHHWLNLYELYCPTEFISNGWNDESFISPWRNDKRPLMGIFHGIYVFSNVYNVLNYLGSQSSTEESERINRIGAQVKRGIEIMESHDSKLSKEANEVFHLIKTRFLKVYENTDYDLRIKHYNNILKEERLKN